jgi:hypothetical protein
MRREEGAFGWRVVQVECGGAGAWSHGCTFGGGVLVVCARCGDGGRVLRGGQVIGGGYIDLGGVVEKGGPELDSVNNPR